MARLTREDAARDELPEQEQVTDQVADLVADALVREAQRVLDRPCLVENEQVVVGQMRSQAGGAELLRFLLQQKRPGRRNLLDERLRRDPEYENLMPDRTAPVSRS